MQINKIQKILLLLTLLNLAIVLLFPPFDDYSVSSHGAAIFAGFWFFFSVPKAMTLNSSLLYLEVMVVLINLGILWMLTTENARRKPKNKLNLRKAAMILVLVNLLVVLLFPPFEYVSNMTNAMIPTFEGFYFIFSHPPYRVIVTPVLYLEVIFILINAGFMLLAFRQKDEDMTAEQAIAYAAKLRSKGGKSRWSA